MGESIAPATLLLPSLPFCLRDTEALLNAEYDACKEITPVELLSKAIYHQAIDSALRFPTL